MNVVFRFLRSHLLLVVALGSSALLLMIGLVLIYSAPQVSQELPTQLTTASELGFDIPPLPDVDNSPPADLSSVQFALQEMSRGVIPSGQTFSPEVIAEALATVEVGSETWCDILLLKADADWTEAEAQQFAQDCI